MPSSDWKVELVDASGQADMTVAVVGDQVVDLTGATPGDVLTVQPDGTVAPDPAGAPLASQVQASLVSGNVVLNSVAVIAVPGVPDLVLDAAAGDVIDYRIDALIASAAVFVGFDVYTIVAGAPVNPFSLGLSASLGTTSGAPAWYVTNQSNSLPISGVQSRTLVSGDIAAGTVTMRLYYAQNAATNRTLLATATSPVRVGAVNRGPFA